MKLGYWVLVILFHFLYCQDHIRIKEIPSMIKKNLKELKVTICYFLLYDSIIGNLKLSIYNWFRVILHWVHLSEDILCWFVIDNFYYLKHLTQVKIDILTLRHYKKYAFELHGWNGMNPIF